MGKIIADLDATLAKKKMTLIEFPDQTNIGLSDLSILKTNKVKVIHFSTLSGICRVLSCNVGDLLRYEEDEDDETNL